MFSISYLIVLSDQTVECVFRQHPLSAVKMFVKKQFMFCVQFVASGLILELSLHVERGYGLV